MPPEYSYVENLLYHVVVEEILDEEAYKQRIDDDRAKAEADAASLRERLPQVQALASETLKSYKNGSLQVQSSPNGVLYTIHEEGAGQLPSKDRMVTVQYYGVLVNEERSFDNSFRAGRGFPFRIGKGEVIPGWDEAIPLLPVGTKASLFIPSELAYGETGFGNEIPPNSELYFYVEIEELFY
jgi:FKBP-type peptidyl-prolyl cis-trans isomerase